MPYIAIGRREAELVTEGSRKGNKGYLIRATIFLGPQQGSKVWTDEIFGPMLCIKTFKIEREAVAMANATVYGLASE